MKEDMLEVLIYLFENYIIEEAILESGQAGLEEELEQAGFPHEEINKAFAWLEGLLEICNREPLGKNVYDELSFRTYTVSEERRLSLQAQSMLSGLMAMGMLDWRSREMVIDCVMALDSAHVSLHHIKWVVLMVISNQPNFQQLDEWVQVLQAQDLRPTLH